MEEIVKYWPLALSIAGLIWNAARTHSKFEMMVKENEDLNQRLNELKGKVIDNEKDSNAERMKTSSIETELTRLRESNEILRNFSEVTRKDLREIQSKSERFDEMAKQLFDFHNENTKIRTEVEKNIATLSADVKCINNTQCGCRSK